MEARKYLQKARYLKKEISYRDKKVEILHNEMIAYKERADEGKYSDAYTRTMMILYNQKKEAIEGTISRRNDLVSRLDEIARRVEAVKPEIYSHILYMRYIDGKSVEEIAQEMNYTRRWISKLCSEALKVFAKNNPDVVEEAAD